MRDLLTKVLMRPIRRLATGTTLGMMVAVTAVVSTSRVHDTRLDDAILAVEKAQALVAAAECGVPGEKSTEACEREVRKALDQLARAYAAIGEAAVAADGGESAPRD
jgi:hypothetical protein